MTQFENWYRPLNLDNHKANAASWQILRTHAL